mmetsp:Transcript_20435/g.69519  ORF Transcript_20435/g.69519 Transcript_20435/m.69519 type:complete len:145 (+) Transcript_20435:197-631(+)
MGKGSAMGGSSQTQTLRLPYLTNTHTHSFFGRQPVASKVTFPSYVFGRERRTLPGYGRPNVDTARLVNGVPCEQYISATHATINLSRFSPGPCYKRTNALGAQMDSRKRTAPGYSFGTSTRRTIPRPDATKPDQCSPGPANYNF